MMPAEVPQLTPLMVSNPGDSFDPADPWFDALDPSRQGLSFSRRYGFVMDTMTDPLPPNTAIWLRKVSGSPELGFYRYSGSAPKAWEPIFGTAGTTNALFWNGMMFHPGVTAPPGTRRVERDVRGISRGHDHRSRNRRLQQRSVGLQLDQRSGRPPRARGRNTVRGDLATGDNGLRTGMGGQLVGVGMDHRHQHAGDPGWSAHRGARARSRHEVLPNAEVPVIRP